MKRRQLKNEYQRISLAKNFFDKHHIQPSDVSTLSNTLNGLNHVSTKKIYIERATGVEHDEWKNIPTSS